MTIPQVEELIRTLLTLCPRDVPEINKSFALAWSRALLPYRARDVEAAALEYSRKKAFFPELATLTAAIKPITDDVEHLQIMFSLATEYMDKVQAQISGELLDREQSVEYLRGIEYCDNQCDKCFSMDCEKSPRKDNCYENNESQTYVHGEHPRNLPQQ